MKTISRYIMTLALLITAVGGAWADETLLLTIESTGYTSFKSGSKTFDDKVTVTFSDWAYNDGDEYGWYSGEAGSLLTVAGTNGYTITSCKFYTEHGTAVTGYTIAGESPSVFLSDNNVYTDANKSVSIGSQGVKKIEVYGAAAPAATEPTIDVTTNAASEQDLFTEASFNMPAFDATAEYELVRDMAVSMTTKVGDGEDGAEYRIRVKKNEQGEGYVPAEMSPQAMAGLITVTDDIEEKTLTNVTDYTVSIFAIDNNGEPTGDAIAFQDLTPGRYIAKAVAATGSAYEGETAQSNIFVLYQGYEVKVPAGEFATFYKDEPLYADPVTSTDAKLYTITSVTDDKAVLSDAIETAPKNTPLLVYNAGEQDNTFLLIPADAEPNLALTVAPEFKGTLEATTIAASTDEQNNYALNGKQFVWVKDALAIGANKAWLSINTGVPSARGITLVFDEATGVNGVKGVKEVNDGSWYDLNGRKLNGMPTKKGVYLFNGRKVVVK